MTTTTTIKAGDLPQTISLPEGQALTLSGSAGAVGVAYLLDQALGGTNSIKSWAIGAGALPSIGPFSGTQKLMIGCTAGDISASWGDAVLGSALSSDLPTVQSAPIIASIIWQGYANPQHLDFGFEPDLIFVKGPGQYAVIYTREQWYGNIQSFGHTALSGSDAVPGPSITRTGLGLVAGQAAINGAGNAYYALAIKDNGSGILKTWAYNGYRNKTVGAPDNQGTGSNPVTMDLLAGTNPAIVHIKRDAIGAGHEGVWVTPTWAKKENASAVNNSLLTMTADGVLNLSTDIAINENNGGIIGEAHNGFSLHNPGKHWDLIHYTGTGASMRIAANGKVAGIVCIPQAPQQMKFWLLGMGTLAADGGQTPLQANLLYGSDRCIAIGTDAAVNTSGVVYALLVFYESAANEKPAPTCRRAGGVRITTTGSGHIACGTDASLGLAGAHTLEWIGQITDSGSEQFLMGRIGNASTGSRGTPVAGSCNYALSYTRDPDAGLEICTSDQFSSQTTDVSKQQRFRTGQLLRPLTDYHVLITHDGVDKWVLYVNGVPVKWRRLPMSVFGINGIINTAGLSMGFGGRQASGTWAAADRTVHRFGRIYNRALTPPEVAQVFARHFQGVVLNDLSDSATALVEEWKFNDATGSTVAATRNAANNGTIVGGIWVP